MSVEMLSESVSQFGYPALFFALWLGIVGMPIPDEVIVLSAGILTSLRYLSFVPAFIATYLGVVSGLSLGYVLGRALGAPALQWISKKKGMSKHVDRAQVLLEKYGSYALCISYFLPVVRHVVPYLVGIGKMTFRRYAMFSYTTGFVWTLVLFIVGYVVGDNAPDMEALLKIITQDLGIGVAIVIVAVLAGVIGYRRFKAGKVQKQVVSSRQDPDC